MAFNLNTLTAQQQAAAIYIGYYDRAPDPYGMDFWESAVTNPIVSLVDIATYFSAQDETYAVHPFFVAPSASAANAFISELYLNLFNRAPDMAGLEFWSGVLQQSIDGTGPLSVGEIILAIIEGAQNSTAGQDITTLLNKIDVANAWTDAAEAAGLTGATSYADSEIAQNSAKSIINDVTFASSSVDEAKTVITTTFDNFVDSSKFTLTADAPSIIEGDSGTKVLVFKATLDEAPTQAISVNYETLSSGTATSGDDFVAVAGVVTFAAGQTVATVSVTVLADAAFEADETIEVKFSGTQLTADVTATGTITNNDLDPQIALEAAYTAAKATYDAAVAAAATSSASATAAQTAADLAEAAVNSLETANAYSTAAQAAQTAAAAAQADASAVVTAATAVQAAAAATLSIADDATVVAASTTALAAKTAADAAKSAADAEVANAAAEIANYTSQTYTLTAGADNLLGGSGNDTFSALIDGTTAANTTLSAADQVNGGNGTDVFNLTLQGLATANTPTPSFSGVEEIAVRNVSANATIVNAGSYIGATEFVNDRSTAIVEFTNIGTADLTVRGNDVITNGDTDFTAGTTSVTDAFTLNVEGGVGGGAITNATTAGVADANGDWIAVTINSTGGTATATTAANVVGALDLAGGDTMQSLTINATSSLTTGVITGWDTTGGTTANKGLITITGAGAVNIGALNAAVEDIVATNNSGGVTLTASSQTDFTFAGSSGNDRVTTDVVLTSGASVDAAGGTDDRLIVTDTVDITATTGAFYTNFESLQVNDGVTVDLDNISGIGSIRINDGAGATGVTDLSAAQAGAVTLVAGGAGAVTIGVKDATTVGQIDTVKIAVDDGATAVNTITLTAPVLTGVEKLELNAATDAVTVTDLTSAAALDGIIVNATHSSGTTTIVSGTVIANANTLIDATGSTASVVLNYGGVTAGTNAISLKGGSGDDTITSTGVTDDFVDGGDGIDTITVTQDAATAEVVTVTSSALVSANSDLITGFQSAEDKYDYNGTLSNGTGAGAGIAAAEVASAATIAAALATVGAANDIVFIATTDLAAGDETALDAAVAGGMTAAEADAVEAALVATGGALNGTIANLDSVLGAGDSVLFQFSTDTDTMVVRVTNTDTSTANTLTVDEIELIGVFANTIDLVAADYI